MKEITKFVAFDDEEFDLEEDCKQYELNRRSEIYEYIENMESDKTTKLPFHNGYSEIVWYSIHSIVDLQMLYDYATIEFEDHSDFCIKIINEDYIGTKICIDFNDYYIFVYGTSEEYKELVNKLF